ncbi:MAG: hypothetical protein K8T26_17590 [Lentisphaerae bacterium]|nr:hypothetical protein [Lentisphaerota bacterium]
MGCHRLMLVVVAGTLAGGPAGLRADTIAKANNNQALDSGASWLGGVSPGSNDIARWDSLATVQGSPLASPVTWLGIQIADPPHNFTIPSTNHAITLGAGGIDLSAATRSFTNNAGLVVGADQVWNVATGLSLRIGGTLSGTAAVTKSGGGTVWLNGNAAGYGGLLTLNGGTLSANAAGLGGATGHVAVTASSTLNPTATATLGADR